MDIEYFVQAMQITDDRLAAAGRLTNSWAYALSGIYGFLRRLFDGLRVVWGHARDLSIPVTDSAEFAYLA